LENKKFPLHFLRAFAILSPDMKNKLNIINEGEDDCNLWLVVDEKNNAVFSSRNYYLAVKFVSENE
jgi:hypothetical protein